MREYSLTVVVSTSPAASRLVAEAARLFAEKGYASTSIADIQLACGLTAGSGALYKHFASKRDLLDAVVQVHLDSMRSGARLLEDVPDSLAAALQFVAEAVHDAMTRDRDALRVILRDLDAAPNLLDRVWDELQRQVYGEFESWLLRREDVSVEREDVAATATVLLAGLTAPALLQALVGRTPGALDLPAFRAAWVRHAHVVLTR